MRYVPPGTVQHSISRARERRKVVVEKSLVVLLGVAVEGEEDAMMRREIFDGVPKEEGEEEGKKSIDFQSSFSCW